MKLRLALSLLLIAGLLAPVFATDPVLDTDEKKTFYALGKLVSTNLEAFGMSEAEYAIFASGLADGVLGREPKVDIHAFQSKIQDLALTRRKLLTDKNKVEAAKFLSTWETKPGAQKSASGLIYIETKAGTGASPAATDTVTVHYHGTLADGSVFDSSVQRGKPAEFALNGVIPCWTEGVQKMKVGGKATLVCPSDIAYGDQGRPGIPPAAPLVFEVELIAIAGK